MPDIVWRGTIMEMTHNIQTEAREVRIGPHYAVNELFRTIHASWEHSSESWDSFLYNAYRSRFSPQTIEEIRRRVLTDYSSKSLLAFEETHGRRLGKPTVAFNTTRILNDRFLCINGERAGMEHEVMVVRHERSTITPTKCDNISVVSHLAINRHAIERIYERDYCPNGGLLDQLRDDLVQAERYAAFAFAAGLYIGKGPRAPGAATAIPYRDGLLFVCNYIVAMRARLSPSSWVKINRTGHEIKRVLANPGQTVTLEPYRDTKVVGYIVPMAATYVPQRMLRFEQQAYVANFLEAADQHDLLEISRRSAFNGLHQHQREAAEAIEIETDPRLRLHYLLGITLRSGDPTEMWTPIGWSRKDHPNEWGSATPKKPRTGVARALRKAA